MLKNFRKLISLLDPNQRIRVMFIVALMAVTAFLQMAGVASIMPFLAVVSDPDIIQRNAWLALLYDRFGFESAMAFLYFLGLAAFAIFVAGTALQALTEWIITRFSHLQQYNLSRRLMASYLSRPYTFFLTRNSGDLSKTLLQETTHAVSGALLPAMRLLSHLLTAIAIISLLVVAHPWLAAIVAIVLGTVYGSIYLVARSWLHRIGKERVKANQERYTAASEAFSGAKEIRLLGREHTYQERYRRPSKRYALHQANATLLGALPQHAIEAIAFGGVILLVLFLISSGGSIAQALPLIGLYALAGKQLIPAFQKVFKAVSSLRFTMPAVDNVLRDLDEGGSPTSPSTGHPPPNPLAPVRGIRVRNVSYRYPGTDAPSLNDISLEIPALSTVGFVGSSGAGKSTLIDVLLGLLEPEEGVILVDDVPLDPTNIRSWQAAIGYVPQHIFLADQSIAANIALGVPASEIDHAAVERAARLADLHDFVVNELPEAYETIIGERGVRLSGGQRQRIGIARALYRDPPVLLFDEATSALDNTTEQAVMSAIHNLSGAKTILLIAHRLSTVRACEHIFVMNKGRLAEKGTWQELTDLDGLFQRLVTGQKATESLEIESQTHE